MIVTIWYSQKKEIHLKRRWFQFWKPRTWIEYEYPIKKETLEMDVTGKLFLAIDDNIYSIKRIWCFKEPNDRVINFSL